MKKHKLIPSVLVILVVSSIAMVMTVQYRVKAGHSNLQEMQLHQDDIENVPIVDYDYYKPSASRNSSLRWVKGSRYNYRDKIVETQDEKEETTDVTQWFIHTPAIPAAESDVILVGVTVGANAFLSNDRGYVYSEFTFNVETILKNDAIAPINSAEQIIAEREGGAVRFASGRIQKYRIYGQGMPQTGRRYILFLKRNEMYADFSVLTGYELRDNQVYPLDNIDLYTAYKGHTVDDFLLEIGRKETKLLANLPTLKYFINLQSCSRHRSNWGSRRAEMP